MASNSCSFKRLLLGFSLVVKAGFDGQNFSCFRIDLRNFPSQEEYLFHLMFLLLVSKSIFIDQLYLATYIYTCSLQQPHLLQSSTTRLNGSTIRSTEKEIKKLANGTEWWENYLPRWNACISTFPWMKTGRDISGISLDSNLRYAALRPGPWVCTLVMTIDTQA